MQALTSELSDLQKETAQLLAQHDAFVSQRDKVGAACTWCRPLTMRSSALCLVPLCLQLLMDVDAKLAQFDGGGGRLKRWRDDGRCGPQYPAPGAPTYGECDPNANADQKGLISLFLGSLFISVFFFLLLLAQALAAAPTAAGAATSGRS